MRFCCFSFPASSVEIPTIRSFFGEVDLVNLDEYTAIKLAHQPSNSSTLQSIVEKIKDMLNENGYSNNSNLVTNVTFLK